MSLTVAVVVLVVIVALIVLGLRGGPPKADLRNSSDNHSNATYYGGG